MSSGEIPIREAARPTWDAPPVDAPLVPLGAAPLLSEREQAARRWAVRWVIIAVVMVFVYSVIGHTEWAPDYALVATDAQAKAYLSPVCAFGRGNLPVTTIAAAKKSGFHADSACAKNGGFLGASQTAGEELLSKVHLYPARGTRWRADGSWKW